MVINPLARAMLTFSFSVDEATRVACALDSYHAVLSDTLNARMRARGNDGACGALRTALLATEAQHRMMREAITRACAQLEDTANA